MAEMESVTRLPDDFDGRVRLFPLPDLVVFPHAMQPLHLFEPRYCELLQESLATDRLITMATISPKIATSGFEPPDLDPIVCISRIISHVATEENRHNVLLLGAQRARIRRELDTKRSFRMAEVEVISDVYPPSGAQGRKALRERLLTAFRALIPAAGEVHNNLHELMSSQMPLGPITDIIAYTLQFNYRRKIGLLAEGNVDQRAAALATILENLAVAEASTGDPEESRFPPPFSLN